MTNHVLSVDEVEMLHALYQLRYLTTEQIASGWYRHRSAEAVRKRLGKLERTGAIFQTRTFDERYSAVWSIDSGGLQSVRSARAGRYPQQRPLSPRQLPHLVETNHVFFTLCSDECLVWERLAFEWHGSNRAAFNFEERRRDDYGVLRRRGGRLIPDALVTPKAAKARRVFVELDRSTECIREQDGRTSIRRKLRAYQTFLFCETWYRDAFDDSRPARLIFVLSRRDTRAADPELRDRRKRSILTAAEEVAPDVSIRVVYLGDEDEIRTACGLPQVARRERHRGSRHATRPTPRWTREHFRRVNRLHQQISLLYPTLPPEMQREILASANDARAVLAEVSPALVRASARDAGVHPHARRQDRDASDATGPSTTH